MHRTYKPVLPTHSKLLQQRWDSAYYDEHRRRVASASSTIDTRPPQTYMHLHLKLKRLQTEEERLAVIERDNRTLLAKMATIMKTNGGVDNQNNCEYKSLNREKRLRELLQVTKENEQMMKRISKKKPEYDHTEWDRDWATNQQYMEQISAYPKDWWKNDSQSRATSARSTQRSKSSVSQRDKSTTGRSEAKSAASQSDKSSTGRSDVKSHPATDHPDSKPHQAKGQPDSRPHQAKGHQDPSLRDESSTGRSDVKSHPATDHPDSKPHQAKGQPDSKPHQAKGHQDSKSTPANSQLDLKHAAAQPVKSSAGQSESAKKY